MKRLALMLVWIGAVLGLTALGTWQVQRLALKRQLIAQVQARLAAPPVSAPATAVREDAYRRVAVIGIFDRGRDTFVQASTVRGPGWWVLTPMSIGDGRRVLINRGYVPTRTAAPPQAEQVEVTGLLRLSEPGGGFLRSNDPAADRWYSRDVAAIAARRRLGHVASYFIDAAASEPDGPIGGLTVVQFPNNHLAYALTWYVLAVMAAAGFVRWLRMERRT